MNHHLTDCHVVTYGGAAEKGAVVFPKDKQTL